MEDNRIRITTFFLHPNTWWGGAQIVHLRVATWLAQQGIPNEIVVSRVDRRLPFQVPNQVTLTSLKTPTTKLRGKPISGMLALATVFKLAQYLLHNRPNVLVGGGYDGWIALLGWKLAKVPTRFIFWEHAGVTARRLHASNLREFLAPTFARFYRMVDILGACSQGVAEDLAHLTGLPQDQIRVIYNPIAPDLFERAKEPVDHPWFNNPKCPVILSVARLDHPKDIPTLLRAFALVRQHRSARLLILGEGSERPKLERMVSELGLREDVDMPGFVDNPFKFMKRAAVLVLSSRFEGFGLVLAEALACGCPVVATDCPMGPAEILEGGKWGKLITVGDVEGMARAILSTLNEPVDHEALRRRAMDFHIDRIGQQWLQLLKEWVR